MKVKELKELLIQYVNEMEEYDEDEVQSFYITSKSGSDNSIDGIEYECIAYMGAKS